MLLARKGGIVMILADKIISLRKKAGWSQEELAQQLGVTRQSVSKWEGAQSVPDMDKILQMSRLFGVSTDFLLKDEIEAEEKIGVGEDSQLRRVTMKEAAEYIELRRTAAPKMAFATFLCVISPVALIFLAGLSEMKSLVLSENLAAGIGLCILFLLVAVAVAIFLSCSSKSKEYRFLEEEPFETEYGVSGMVNEKKKEYSATYSRLVTIGTVACILSVLPMFLSIGFNASDIFCIVGVCLLLIIAAVGVYLFVLGGVRQSSFNKLLEEEDYTRDKKSASKIKSAVAVCYWLVVTAIFLVFTCGPSGNAQPENSWIIWAVAGVVYGGIVVLMNSFGVGKKK